MNIVITGASGFIGGWVARAVATAIPDAAVYGVGRRSAPVLPVPCSNYEYVQSDLRLENLRRKLPGHADVIMHLAGDPRTRVPSIEWSHQTDTNVMGTTAVADYAEGAGVTRVVYASSVYVYSGVREVPYLERHLEVPTENLGASKLAAEGALRARALAGNFEAVALRIFTVYGPGSRPEQFIPEAIRKLRSSNATAQFGQPGITRDFVYVGDVAAAFVASLKPRDARETFQAVNVGTGIETSIREVVMTLAGLLGTSRSIAFAEDVPAAGAVTSPTRQAAAILKAERVLGWKPAVTLREGLQHMMKDLTAPASA